mgnify:CR=1 FL=1
MSTLGIDSVLNSCYGQCPDRELLSRGFGSFFANVLRFSLGEDSSLRVGLRWIRLLNVLGLILFLLTACQNKTPHPVRKIVLQQSWELNAGDLISGHLITGGLGDITVDLDNRKLRAPFPGKVELAAEGPRCIYYSTPDIPAYLFRYCGVRRPVTGPIDAGEVIGRGDQLQFATLRRMPDGTWAIVEPSNQVLEKTLRPPSRPSLF